MRITHLYCTAIQSILNIQSLLQSEQVFITRSPVRPISGHVYSTPPFPRCYLLVAGLFSLNPLGPFCTVAVSDSWTFSKYQVIGVFDFSFFPCHCLCEELEIPTASSFCARPLSHGHLPVLLDPGLVLAWQFWVMCKALTCLF